MSMQVQLLDDAIGQIERAKHMLAIEHPNAAAALVANARDILGYFVAARTVRLDCKVTAEPLPAGIHPTTTNPSTPAAIAPAANSST